MTKAQQVCAALGVGPDEMADVCRREAARLLRGAAQVVLAPEWHPRPGVVHEAQHWIRWARLFEAEHDRQLDRKGEDGGGRASIGGEAEGSAPPTAVPQQVTGWGWAE